MATDDLDLSEVFERPCWRCARMQVALEELAQLGEQGMAPNYREWITLHDKVAQIARNALAEAGALTTPPRGTGEG